MFYYLLYNSSFAFIINNKIFLTILYGSILYILTHAILNYCNITILNIINNYFWLLFTLDIISLLYCIINNSDELLYNSTDISFNLFKNKINTIFNRKNDLTITHIDTTPIQHNKSITKLSTPLTQLKQQHIELNDNNTPTTNTYSTPINVIRSKNIENKNNLQLNTCEDNSVAGSDIACLMDLDDFEKTL